jgi:Subtilase family
LRRIVSTAVSIALLVFPLTATTGANAGQRAKSRGIKVNKEIQDATVVAVLDFTFSPYHWDFDAGRMPQHRDRSVGNDIPLRTAPHKWLPGFPNPKTFQSYNPINLSLDPGNGTASPAALQAKDQKKWDKVKQSTSDKVHFYWLPGTKVIGAIEFGDQKIVGGTNEHGTGVASVSAGNIHGTCPECLLVFVDINAAESAEEAMEWVTAQPWIDAVSNSYGHGSPAPKIYTGRTVGNQRKASDRGQTIFFSAGNGFENAFTVTNPTYMSSQKGPDWLVTVGAVSPGDHGSYVGHGKPADVASLGSGYPSAYNSPTVSGEGNFSGTSNASPTVMGIYARALYEARKALPGPSRMQANGIVANGSRFNCGAARDNCELSDGKLTADELRTRFFHGAVHTTGGTTDPIGFANAPAIGEEEFLSEGHGSYFGLETKQWSDYMKEFARIIDPILGRAKTLDRPDGERAWMIVDSFCRQHLWGAWRGGYYVEGKTDLPGPDPAYPLRSSLESGCPLLPPQD